MKNFLQFSAIFFIITSAFAQSPDSTLRELPDQRTYFSKTYYNARDNTYTARISPGYVHYLAGDGTFKDIDTRRAQPICAWTRAARITSLTTGFTTSHLPVI